MHLWLCSQVLVARSVRLPEIHHWSGSWCLHYAYTISFAFTQEIKVEVGCVESLCNSNRYQSPTKWVPSCHCKWLEDWFVVLFQGTVTPTHYVVLRDTANMKTDRVQQLMYKLCHLYCNWPGTMRVPAACLVSIVQDTSDWQECLYLKGLCFVKYLTIRFGTVTVEMCVRNRVTSSTRK